MKLLLALLLAFVLVGCEKIEGNVVAKGTLPAYTTIDLMYVTDGNGGVVAIPVMTTVPERYYLDLKTFRGDRRIVVPRELYDRTAVGTYLTEK